MERTLWKDAVELVGQLVPNSSPRHVYCDRDIVLIFLWAVLHDRPISWACRRENWPIWEHQRPLPWPSTMTRRLRTQAVQRALTACQETLRDRLGRNDRIFAIDGKSLPIGGASGDPDCGYGRAARGKARGYKLHAIIGKSGAIWDWQVHPMNVDERPVAKRMIRQTAINGLLLGDRNYDANHLFDAAGYRGIQLLTERRNLDAKGIGHRRQSRFRLRCIEALNSEVQGGARALVKQRGFIERAFGNLTSAAYGLGHLPAWARRITRVTRWVHGKIIFFMLARLQLASE